MIQNTREITKGAALYMAREMFGQNGFVWFRDHETASGRTVRLFKVGTSTPGDERTIRGTGANWAEALKDARENGRNA